MTVKGVIASILCYFTDFVYNVIVKQLLGCIGLIFCDHITINSDYSAIILAIQEKVVASTSDCSCLRPCHLMNFLWQWAGPLCSTAGWTGESTLKLGLMGRSVA